MPVAGIAIHHDMVDDTAFTWRIFVKAPGNELRAYRVLGVPGPKC